jgi:hypothetical protein
VTSRSTSSRGSSPSRGTERLLWDCATIGCSLEVDRSPAGARLDAELGEELTGLVLATLCDDQPSTPHEQRPKRAADGGAA